MIRFGACECCAAYKEEILFLRSLLRPKPIKFESLPTVTLEADAVIGGTDQQLDFSEEERQRQNDIDSERASLLAGTY